MKKNREALSQDELVGLVEESDEFKRIRAMSTEDKDKKICLLLAQIRHMEQKALAEQQCAKEAKSISGSALLFLFAAMAFGLVIAEEISLGGLVDFIDFLELLLALGGSFLIGGVPWIAFEVLKTATIDNQLSAWGNRTIPKRQKAKAYLGSFAIGVAVILIPYLILYK